MIYIWQILHHFRFTMMVRSQYSARVNNADTQWHQINSFGNGNWRTFILHITTAEIFVIVMLIIPPGKICSRQASHGLSSFWFILTQKVDCCGSTFSMSSTVDGKKIDVATSRWRVPAPTRIKYSATRFKNGTTNSNATGFCYYMADKITAKYLICGNDIAECFQVGVF